jgi:hypothetical protein
VGTEASRENENFARASTRREHLLWVLGGAIACASPIEADPGIATDIDAGATSLDGTSSDASTEESGAEDDDAPASESGSSGEPDPTTTTESTESSSSSGSIEVECTTARVMVAPGANLNVRPSASTTEDPIGTLTNADLVDVLDEVEGELIESTTTWLHIATTDLDGYISKAHASCMLDECSFFDIPEAEYLTYGLHPDGSDALVFLGITDDGITQTIGNAADSAGTHAQDGTADGHDYSAAVDLRVIGLSDAAIEQYIADLAAVGYAGWYRQPGADGVPSDWSPHIHAVWVGASMKASLRDQVRSWVDGRNGLVSDTPYQFHEWPECMRDAIWERYLENNPE